LRPGCRWLVEYQSLLLRRGAIGVAAERIAAIDQNQGRASIRQGQAIAAVSGDLIAVGRRDVHVAECVLRRRLVARFARLAAVLEPGSSWPPPGGRGGVAGWTAAWGIPASAPASTRSPSRCPGNSRTSTLPRVSSVTGSWRIEISPWRDATHSPRCEITPVS